MMIFSKSKYFIISSNYVNWLGLARWPTHLGSLQHCSQMVARAGIISMVPCSTSCPSPDLSWDGGSEHLQLPHVSWASWLLAAGFQENQAEVLSPLWPSLGSHMYHHHRGHRPAQTQGREHIDPTCPWEKCPPHTVRRAYVMGSPVAAILENTVCCKGPQKYGTLQLELWWFHRQSGSLYLCSLIQLFL